jgi:hypothetical protein
LNIVEHQYKDGKKHIEKRNKITFKDSSVAYYSTAQSVSQTSKAPSRNALLRLSSSLASVAQTPTGAYLLSQQTPQGLRERLPYVEQALMRNTHSQKIIQNVVDRHSFNANILHNARIYKDSMKSQDHFWRPHPGNVDS